MSADPYLSTDATITVAVRDGRVKGSDKTFGQVAAHELYLHAYNFLLFKGGASVSPLHGNADGSPSTVDIEKDMIEDNVNN